MDFKVEEISNENLWESFFLEIKEKTFLNSWAWTLFREDMGDEVYRRGVWVDGELIAVFFASKVKARKGDFLLLSHSPSIKETIPGLIKKISDEIKRIGKKEKVCFVRVAPVWKKNSNEDKELKKEGFLDSSSFVFPEKSRELCLRQNEQEILSQMRKGTRYMIKKGIKDEDLNVFLSRQKNDIKTFYDVYEKTAFRHNFVPFSLEYIEKEFDFFSKRNEIILVLVKNENKCLAGAVIVFWQGTAFYHHGASIIDKKNSSASYLVQWEAIKEARKRKCEKYNFWVVSPSNDSNHRWSGLTFFKKGFGGYEINYAPTKDFPFSKKYWLTYIFEKIKDRK